jgi:anti-sigma B factor antagonist
MELDIRKSGETLIVAINDSRLDAAVAEEFKAKLLAHIESGEQRLVINMKNVAFVDSTGMTAIVSVLKKLVQSGGNLAVCEVGPRLEKLFQITKLDKVFNMCPSEEDALNLVAG